MKTKKQIEAQIKKLVKISSSGSIKDIKCAVAYEAYHALRWVIEDTDWSPWSNIEGFDWQNWEQKKP